jgi:hypothetical protein
MIRGEHFCCLRSPSVARDSDDASHAKARSAEKEALACSLLIKGERAAYQRVAS